MKYFGEKSLSSVLSRILQLLWYAVLILSIAAVIAGVLFLFYKPLQECINSEIAKGNISISDLENTNSDCGNIKNWPLFFKIIIIPYFAAVMTLLLQIIKKSQNLFNNFKNEIVFNRSNVLLLSTISKLNIGFSILTFSFSSLLVSLMLFMLCEIFKSGTALQEEHDFTV